MFQDVYARCANLAESLNVDYTRERSDAGTVYHLADGRHLNPYQFLDALKAHPGYLLLCTWSQPPAGAIQEIVERMSREGLRFGHNTSAWHEITQWHRDHDNRAKCSICGSKLDRRETGSHYRCQLRRERGLPTPPMNDAITCPCSRCKVAA